MKKLLLSAVVILLLSCSKEYISEGEAIVQVIPKSLDPRFDTYYGQLITLEALATQNYNPEFYNFDLINGCEPLVTGPTGETFSPSLEDIALQKFPVSEYSYKAKCN